MTVYFWFHLLYSVIFSLVNVGESYQATLTQMMNHNGILNRFVDARIFYYYIHQYRSAIYIVSSFAQIRLGYRLATLF